MSEMLIIVPKMFDLPYHRGETSVPKKVYAETVPSFWPDQAGGRLLVIVSGTKEAMGVLGRSQGRKVVVEVQWYIPYPEYVPSHVEEMMCVRARRV